MVCGLRACASCGQRIALGSFWLAGMSGRRWSIACPHCEEVNRIALPMDMLLALASLFGAMLLAMGMTGGGEPGWLCYGIAVALWIVLRNLLVYGWLTWGKFRTGPW